VALLHKVPNCKCVLDDVARGEALVSLFADQPNGTMIITIRETHHVKEGEVLFFLDNVTEFLPLLWCGVDTSGVLERQARCQRKLYFTYVSTCVEQNLSHKLFVQYKRIGKLTMDPSGAALMSAFIPSKSRPTVSLSKYLQRQNTAATDH
jgi:hypothetical protein